MGKKVISNTFTVNTVEDGMSQQQIFTRNANAALPPRSQSDTPTLPSGWTYTPQGVDNTHPDEYVSMRSKDSSGVWSDYSPKVPYSHYGEDGTSLRIVGYANWLFGRNASGDPKPAASDIVLGDVDLLEYSSYASADHIEVCEEISTGVYSWEAYAVELGTCYIFSGNNHIYEATESGWLDLGNIKGPKGDDAVNYDIVFSEAWAKVDNSGVISARLKGIAYKITGSNRVPQAGVTIRYGYILNDSDTYTDATTSIDGSFDSGTWFDDDEIDGYAKNSQNIFAAIIINNTVMCTKYVTIANKGATGAQGKMGRNLWFAGWWDDIKGQTFSVDDHNAPYVQTGWADPSSKKIPVCKVFIGANGSFTYPSTVAGYENNVNWGAMVSDFEYLITKAVFAALAKLGSWTFNSDYMYSDLGLNHSSQQESAQGNLRYDGIDDSDNTWTPNVSIDAANGRASFSRDKVRFNPDGAGWLANKNIQWDANGNASFNGTITAMMYYAYPFYLPDGQYSIDLVNEPHMLFVSDAMYSDVVLPNASSYDGMELQFIWLAGTRARLGYLKFVSEIVVRAVDEYGNVRLVTKTNAYIDTCSVVTLKSLLGRWYLVSGELTDMFTP